MSHKIHEPRCQLLASNLASQLYSSKLKAQAVAIKLDAVSQDKVIKSKAAVIISLLYDAENLLAEIQEEMKWT